MNAVRIILIVSGSLGQTFIPSIHDLTQIAYVYIFCFDVDKHNSWTKQWNKIRGVYNNENSLSRKLKDDLRSLTEVNLPFGLFDTGQRSLKDLNNEQASFMWSQLITEVLLRLPQSSEAKAEMIGECRLSYKDNEVQLKNIEIFEKSYRENEAIKWYTKNGFIFQLFNKAFRRQDFEVIFKYRYFLLDLFKEIHSLYVQQYQTVQQHLTVYRGQMMWKSELMKIKQNVGHLISINTFFSTSISPIVAASFCGNGEYESEGIVSVMFEIELDASTPSRPFARIETSSVIGDEREVLFSMGTVFHVENVDQETDTIWLVKLTWNHQTQEKLKEMKQLTDLLDFYTGQRIGDHPSILTFGYFLSKMGLLRQALRFYVYLRKTLPKDHSDRGVLHNNLGEVLRKLNYFNQARYHFEKSLELCADTMSIYHPLWAIVHSNIALLNLNCRKPKEALKCYRYAAFILSRYIADDVERDSIYIEEALAGIYHGMGAAFIYLEEYQNATVCQQKALKIELRILPNDHPTLVESYHELGSLYMKLKKYSEALKNYETALQIAQKNLLEKDQRYIWLHVNIATLTFYIEAACYQDLNDNKKALYHYQHSLDILTVENKEESIQTAIIHCNIALIHFELDELSRAEEHLRKSLVQYKKQSKHQSDLLDVKIYIALVKIYQRWGNRHMVCNYYQCIVNQMKIDRAEPSIIKKFEKLLQNAIEKINVD
ncbi:unnamed protein product [Adineta steineri]|uniref:NAD(P)(+)--arginine ADP-ribosyltransferase n=1 Tax=Adineta steineri TaxID=433720 RepID=A0A815EGR9_9BILA|nr:unnamed protein product [Adineta steineri]CAF1306469.1 unnamed protein product [Adineta steineri]